MSKMRGLLLVLFALVLLVPAAEAAEPGHNFSLYAGWFYPEGSNLDEDFTWGGAYGYNFNERWGVNVQTGFFDVAKSFNDAALGNAIEGAPLSLDLWLFDFTAVWYPGGGNFGVFAGLGWATLDAELYRPGDNRYASDDTFTYNFGVNYQWNIGDSFFIRPEARVRWFDASNVAYDENQWETVAHFGWRF